MKEFYTIGEISKIFNIPSATLRYYDSIGLLCPWEIGENNYRYYSKAQFEIISMIMFMRSINTPIKKLQVILNEKTADGILDELKTCEASIDEKIKELELLKQKIGIFNKNIEVTCYNPKITLEKLPEMYMMSKSFGDEDELDIDEIIKTTIGAGKWADTAGIISTITKENLQNGRFHDYDRYGYLSEIQFYRKNKYTAILPAGPYVCYGMKVSSVEHFEADDAYAKMLRFIKRNKLKIRGDAIERNVLDLYCGNKNNPTMYFRIYIPVEE
jgi:DNA-binding transcriptional MerR regulator